MAAPNPERAGDPDQASYTGPPGGGLSQILQSIAETTKSTNHILREIAARQAVAESRLFKIEEDISRINQEVFTGNGHPSMVARMATLENDSNDSGDDLRYVRKRLDQVARSLVRMQAGGTEACQKLEERVGRNEEHFSEYVAEQHKKSHNVYLLIGGTVLTGVAGWLSNFLVRG